MTETETAGLARLTGTTLAGRYSLVRPLGEGGTATSWLADDLLRGQPVTLKLLLRSDLLESFRGEFGLLAGLDHPCLVRVRDFGAAIVADGGRATYYTADYVEGVDLATFATGARFDAVRIALADVLSALDFLHELGLRHGDVKPANVIVRSDGHAALIDLGCARPIGRRERTISGTPGFLAPELRNGTGDRRTDLYALGVTIERLAGRIAEPLKDDIRALVARLRADDPRERPSDAGEVLDALGLPASTGSFTTASRLVGRDSELETITRFVSSLEATADGPRLLFIHGPEGIGRTRLLREGKWLGQMRMRVVEGDAFATAPVRDALARALPDSGPIRDLGECLEARQALASADSPTLLVLDDAQELGRDAAAELEALVRSATPSDRLALLVASTEPPPPSAENAAVHLSLGPLDRESIARLCEDRLPEARLDDVERLTGGRPGPLAALLELIRAGDCGAADLARASSFRTLSKGAARRVSALPRGARRALGVVAILGGQVEEELVRSIGCTAEDVRELERCGLVDLTPKGIRLRVAADAGSIEAALPSEELNELRREARAHLEARAAATTRAALRSSHLARAALLAIEQGAVDEARATVHEERAWIHEAPGWWAPAAEALADATKEPEDVLLAAEILELAGHPERALALLDGVEGLSLDTANERRASCLLKLGRAREAAELLERALGDEPDRRPPSIVDLLCRAEIRLGRYESARDRATAALEHAPDDARPRLHEDLGVALSFLGDAAAARRELDQARANDSSAPRDRVRLVSYVGITAFKLGDTKAAADAYTEALAIAERHGLSDQLASAALNLGAALQQLGELGRAIESYERGRRMAIALGQRSTQITLDFNLATLYEDIGVLDRAERLCARALANAEAEGLTFFVAASEALHGEIARARGEISAAEARLERASAALEACGARREHLEVELHRVELSLETGDTRIARERLAACEQALASMDASDVRARALACRARMALLDGDPSHAVPMLERALEHAEASGQPLLRAEIELWLAQSWTAMSGLATAEQWRRRARQRIERLAATLPAHLRQGFLRHTWRASAERTSSEHAVVSSAAPGRSEKLHRLVEINRALTSELDASRVLEVAIDAAMELTGAERGFILLRDRDDFRVGTTRNVDPSAADDPAEFSQGVARRVVEADAPVFSVDVASDVDLATNVSVHAMKLRSVLCVPLRAPSGVFGALYLDNRYRASRFHKGELDILQAFADQAAIALRNARLLADLARERAKVERLLEEQSLEIGRLNETVRAQREALSHRYDYSRIVGRSAAMEQLFSLLDKLTASDATVLLEGESGTGKELIARALHFNGPRNDRPFVSVNCGALPETLLESELFGHVKGAFTGASSANAGLFVTARGGTLFLDEVGEMPSAMQVKLLRALQERVVRPVGSPEEVAVDVRVVAATNRVLLDEVAAGKFREDLYYRVSVVTVSVPPLRERLDDLPLLVEHFLAGWASDEGPARVSRGALDALRRHDWPGNVRELENCLRRALVFGDGRILRAADLGLDRRPPPTKRAPGADERALLLRALTERDWNVLETCKALGIPRATFYRKMRRYDLRRPS